MSPGRPPRMKSPERLETLGSEQMRSPRLQTLGSEQMRSPGRLQTLGSEQMRSPGRLQTLGSEQMMQSPERLRTLGSERPALSPDRHRSESPSDDQQGSGFLSMGKPKSKRTSDARADPYGDHEVDKSLRSGILSLGKSKSKRPSENLDLMNDFKLDTEGGTGKKLTSLTPRIFKPRQGRSGLSNANDESFLSGELMSHGSKSRAPYDHSVEPGTPRSKPPMTPGRPPTGSRVFQRSAVPVLSPRGQADEQDGESPRKTPKTPKTPKDGSFKSGELGSYTYKKKRSSDVSTLSSERPNVDPFEEDVTSGSRLFSKRDKRGSEVMNPRTALRKASRPGLGLGKSPKVKDESNSSNSLLTSVGTALKSTPKSGGRSAVKW